jgi:hypothetical protein
MTNVELNPGQLQQTQGEGGKERASWWKRSGTWSLAALVCIAAIFVTVAVMAVQDDNTTAPCQITPSPAYVPPKAPLVSLAAADPRTKQPPEVDLGFSRHDETLAPFSYTVDGAVPDPAKISWDLLLVNGNEQYPDGSAGVQFRAIQGNLRVRMCLKSAGVAPGTYAGTFTFSGVNFRSTQIPLTVTIKYNNWWWTWGGFVAAILLAVFFKYWTTVLNEPNTPNKPNPVKCVRWFVDQWVTILIAVAGAAGVVYRTRVLDAHTFTADDRWPFWAATFTAVTASTLLLTAIGRAVVPKPDPAKKGGAQSDHANEGGAA